MTGEELIKRLNDQFGMRADWPKKMEVDAETYGNCCQLIFERAREMHIANLNQDMFYLVALGPNKGLMFRNIELIISKL